MGNNHNDLIRHEIKGRKVEYYLVTETDLEQIKTNNIIGDVAFLITSLSFGAFVAGEENVFLVIGLLSLAIALYFYYTRYKFIQKTKNSGALEDVAAEDASISQITTPATNKKSPVRGLRIENAFYYASGNSIDITSHLQKMVSNNSLDIIASNEIAGDPTPGIVKSLRVTYRIDGVRIVKRVKEGERLSLP